MPSEPDEPAAVIPEKTEPNFNNTIGLKLVDLGLGDKFDGKKDKNVIQKKAVDWYMQKTPPKQRISPEPS